MDNDNNLLTQGPPYNRNRITDIIFDKTPEYKQVVITIPFETIMSSINNPNDSTKYCFKFA